MKKFNTVSPSIADNHDRIDPLTRLGVEGENFTPP